MSIKAGDLRHEIVLMRPRRERNERGRSEVTWEDVVTVHAGKADVSGREFWQAQAYHAENVVTFTTRWREDVTTAWRVRFRGTEYNILEVNHLGEMRDFMRLKCQDVQGGGA